MATQSDKISRIMTDRRLESIVMSDPLSETTRRTKRNLILASVTTLIIVNLQLDVSGFFIFKAPPKTVINYNIAAGIAAFFALYSLIMLLYYFIHEYMKWDRNQEIAKTADIGKTLMHQENSNETVIHQLSEIKLEFKRLPKESQPNFESRMENLENKFTQFIKKYEDNWDAIKPMHEAWKKNLENIEKKGDHQIKLKIWGMRILEFALPVSLGFIAILQGRHGIYDLAAIF